MRYCTKIQVLLLILIVSVSVSRAQNPTSEVERFAYFPHWELATNGITQTSLYVTYLGPDSAGVKISIRFLKENGLPFAHQSVTLYEASNVPNAVFTSASGHVDFKLKPNQTAKIVLIVKDFQDRHSFGYATMFWHRSHSNIIVARFLAWGKTKTESKRWLLSTVSMSEPSIAVNGGLPFLLRSIK